MALVQENHVQEQEEITHGPNIIQQERMIQQACRLAGSSSCVSGDPVPGLMIVEVPVHTISCPDSPPRSCFLMVGGGRGHTRATPLPTLPLPPCVGKYVIQPHVGMIGEVPVPMIQEKTAHVPTTIPQKPVIQQNIEMVVAVPVPMAQEKVIHVPASPYRPLPLPAPRAHRKAGEIARQWRPDGWCDVAPP
eukprot:15634777-Heterocapsa_arctica.AAC.1